MEERFSLAFLDQGGLEQLSSLFDEGEDVDYELELHGWEGVAHLDEVNVLQAFSHDNFEIES